MIFGKVDYRVASDKRTILKTIDPRFSEKIFHKESIIFNNNDKSLSNNEELAEIVNKYFSKLVKTIDIDKVLANKLRHYRSSF